MSRVESPSSINTYKQCPRRYFYRYIEKLPSKPSIYLIRGKIVHSVLEDFFDIDESITTVDDLRVRLFWLLEKKWVENREELKSLELGDTKLNEYYEETKRTMQNWFSRFKEKMAMQTQKNKSFLEAFKHLTPIREKEFKSNNHQVRGFIDVIYEMDDSVVILDYKTGKKTDISPEYRLQLGVYALMYEETTGRKPDFVGIDFLNHTERVLAVDQKIVDEAKRDIEYVHSKTISTNIKDYSQKPSPLCKWSTGQCDYYEQCFGKDLNKD